MPNFTIKLIPGGYTIFLDEAPYIEQAFDPRAAFVGGAGQPFASDAAAQAHADAAVASMQAAYTIQPDPAPNAEPPPA